MRYPKSWADVSLGQLYELDELRQRDDLDAEDKMNQVLSVLSRTDIEEIEKQPHTQRIAAYAKMKWLADYPNRKPKRRVFRFAGKWYKIVTNPAAISAGEYATLQVVASDGNFIKNLNQVIACLMVEQKWTWKGWQPVLYDKVRSTDEFHFKARKISQEMSVAQAYPYALFFLKLLPELLKVSQTYFQKMEKELRKQATIG